MKPSLCRLPRSIPVCVAAGIIMIAMVWVSHSLWLRNTVSLRLPAVERVENNKSHLTPTSNPNPGSPVVDVVAFRNHGCLAFVWQHLLYELDGSTDKVKQLTVSGEAMSPLWSYDGQWLAYLNLDDPKAETGSLWLVRRDGSQAHQVQGLPGVMMDQFSWSPTSDVLAVNDQNMSVWLVPAEGKARSLDIDGNVSWSPDGRFLAYSVTLSSYDSLSRTDVLYIVNIEDNKAVQELIAPSGGQISVAGWWPDGKGLLYWLAPTHGASVIVDGLNLWSLRLGAPTPKMLTSCLVDADWLSFSPQGKLLMLKGNSRFPWENKELAIADVKDGSVEVLHNSDGNVALDPTWSPDGNRIAFVAAKDMGLSWSTTSSPYNMWEPTRILWIENFDGTGAHPLPLAGLGVSHPVWSKDGGNILYAREDELWMLNPDDGSSQKIIASPSSGAQISPDPIDYAWFQP